MEDLPIVQQYRARFVRKDRGFKTSHLRGRGCGAAALFSHADRTGPGAAN